VAGIEYGSYGLASDVRPSFSSRDDVPLRRGHLTDSGRPPSGAIVTDIVIIRHSKEVIDISKYSVHLLAEVWREAGHRVTVASGLDSLPDADLAFLHVDLSLVPDPYVAAAQRYPHTVNGGARDIRKRTVSRHLLTRTSDWSGRVVVKSDLNCGGFPEWRIMHHHNPASAFARRTPPGYQLYESVAHVPPATWDSPDRVVEKFLPEQDERGWYLRTWTFLGERGRCRRSRGSGPIVRNASIVDSEPDELDVPDFLHAERERLGFDYGKFDFAMHDGEPILFDANTTFGVIPRPGNRLYHFLGEALDGLLA
jgi:hypothetical protein